MNIVPIINLILTVAYGIAASIDIYDTSSMGWVIKKRNKDIPINFNEPKYKKFAVISRNIYWTYVFFFLVSLGVLLGINSNLIKNPEDTDEEKYKIINITFISFIFVCVIFFYFSIYLLTPIKEFFFIEEKKRKILIVLTLITIGFLVINIIEIPTV